MRVPIIILLILLCYTPVLKSQTNTKGPLTIGEMATDVELSGIVNSPTKTVKLKEFIGSLVILDFWATWCTACVQAFPKMERLKQEFGDSLQIFLVTNEDSLKASMFLQKFQEKRGRLFDLPSSTNGRELLSIFPHTYIPHYVWINRDGKVIAITGSDDVTSENICAVLKGAKPSFSIKKDYIGFDYSSPLFFQGNGGDGTSIICQSLVAGPIQGLVRGGSLLNVESPNMITRVFRVNNSIQELFSLVFPKTDFFPDNRILLEVGQPGKLRWLPNSGQSLEDWKKENTYCYELRTRPTKGIEIVEQIVQDMKRYFSVQGRLEKRKIDCWVLKSTDRIAHSFTKGGENYNTMLDIDLADVTERVLMNSPIRDVLFYLNLSSPVPFLDESGCSKNLDLRFPVDLLDTIALKKILFNQGLIMKKVQREIEVLVITTI